MSDFHSTFVLLHTKSPGPRGDQGLPGEGVATLEPRIAAFEDGGTFINISIDPDNGDDDGLGTNADPLRTPAAVVARMKSGRIHNIFVRKGTRVIWNRTLSLRDAEVRFFEFGTGTADTFVRSVSQSGVNNGSFILNGTCRVQFNAVRPELGGANPNDNAFLTCRGVAIIYLFNAPPAYLTGSNQELIGREGAAFISAEFDGSPITAIAGRVFKGVGAGQNPNGPFITTDLTSA